MAWKISKNISTKYIKEKNIKQINDTRKKNGRKKSYLKRIRNFDTGVEVGGSRHSLAR